MSDERTARIAPPEQPVDSTDDEDVNADEQQENGAQDDSGTCRGIDRPHPLRSAGGSTRRCRRAFVNIFRALTHAGN